MSWYKDINNLEMEKINYEGKLIVIIIEIKYITYIKTIHDLH